MAWWRRSKKPDAREPDAQKSDAQKPGPIAFSVFDASSPAGPFRRAGLLLGERQLPPITARSFTDRVTEQTRASWPAGTGPVDSHLPHSLFTKDRTVAYVGVGDRAAIVVRLTPDLRADLYDLGEAIADSGASLYLDAHAGFLRASLLLPLTDFDLDVGMLLGEGDVQEFLRAAHANETVELHVDHATHDRVLAFTCSAAGIRAAVDAGFDLLAGPAPTDLQAAMAAVNGSLNPSAHIPLRVTGRAALAVTVEVEV
ncbi:hypothetical protein ACGH7X_16315 [Streptomyces sp. BBFR51]|uniref:hypothetical protein n=1 Tax=Streptomyces sp. BBFR51 TaxID=3372856 RepID=UPI0037DCA011